MRTVHCVAIENDSAGWTQWFSGAGFANVLFAHEVLRVAEGDYITRFDVECPTMRRMKPSSTRSTV